MEKTSTLSNKELAKKLDENLFSSKNFKKIYLFCVFWLILSPMIETLFWVFGIFFNMVTQNFLILVLFCLTKLLELCFNFKNISLKRNVTDLLIIGLFAWFLIVTFVAGVYEIYFFMTIFFFSIFVVIQNIDKKYYKTIAFVFAIEMIFDSFLGLIDLHNNFIPGFGQWVYVMSLQFTNPNWSGVVMTIADIVILWFIMKSEKSWQKMLWCAGFAVLTLALFVGGSYSPEFSLICCEIAVLIYYWVKNKKCPIWILFALLFTIFISFFVWFIPAFREVTTGRANFFYESLAVVDGKINTHLTKSVSTLFNKLFGWDIVDGVAGSDGWGRAGMNEIAFELITNNAKSFIFGYGAGYLHKTIRVHNCYMGIWLVFGTVGLLLYLSIFVSLLVRFIKVEKTDKTIIMFIVFVMMLFEKCFYCIEPFCYEFFIIMASVLYKELYSQPLKSKVAKKISEEKMENPKEIVAK